MNLLTFFDKPAAVAPYLYSRWDAPDRCDEPDRRKRKLQGGRKMKVPVGVGSLTGS